MNLGRFPTRWALAILSCLPAWVSAQAPEFSKSFSDSAIQVGETTTLTLLIDNSNGLVGAVDLVFRDDYPLGLQTANPNNRVVTCGGGFGFSSTFFQLDGTVGAGESCSAMIDLVAVTPGLQTNVTGDLTSSLGNSGPATASIVVADAGAPIFTKAFADGVIELGQVTTLTFTLDNSANAGAALTASFVDDLPGGIQVNTPNNLVSTCVGASGGSANQITFTGSVAANSTCTIAIDVIGIATGTQDNVSGELISDAGNSGPALASVEVIGTPLPAFSKAFAASTLTLGEVTTLTLTINNPSAVTDANNLNFTDSLPAGLVVATPANASTTCVGGTLTAVDGSTTVGYTGGTATASTTCNIQADVQAVATGVRQNVTGDLTSSLGNSGSASATIVVGEAGTPAFTKQFTPDVVGENTALLLQFTIDNSANGAIASSLDFTDSLPAGLIVATPANAMTTCTGGTLTAADGSSTISYTGGSVGANNTCTLTVDVIGSVNGVLNSVSGDLTSSAGNSGPALASLTVLDAPAFFKQFESSALSVGGVSSLAFLINNTASILDATALDFTDVLPAGLLVATPANTSTTCVGGTVTAAFGTSNITYSGGSVGAGSLCFVRVDVEATALGTLNNLSGELTSSLGNSGTAADSIDVISALEWNVAGPADWFGTTNWLPNLVPNQGLSASINNGGIALVLANSRPITRDLSIGVNGGLGTLRFESDNSADIAVFGSVDIGVTTTGAANSIGTLEFGEDAGGGFDSSSTPVGPLRVGVTLDDGDADGTLIYPDNFINSTVQFPAVQIGVSDGSGTAMGSLTADARTTSFQSDNGLVQFGVANADGDAIAIVNGSEIEGVSTADIGVSNGVGNANATVQLGFSFEGTSNAAMRGPANIGITNSTGSATAQVTQLLDVIGGVTAELFSELNVGIANGAGNADGAMLNSNGVTIPIINLGLNPGGGQADGRIFVDHGLINTDALTMGSGGVLEFTANSENRATGGGSTSRYSAANADAATLAGEVILNLNFLPAGPTTFEVVNSASPTGITGIIDTVTVNNLPSGMTVGSAVQLDSGGNQQFVVDLLGVPVLPNWINPNTGASAGNWFDGANWSGGFVPLLVDPGIVNNGGEALADSTTAPGPATARDIIIGQDGGTGLMTSNGVNLEPRLSFLIAKVSPLISAEQTATGTMVLNDASIIVPLNDLPSNSPFDPGSVIAVGFAQGNGTAEASMEVNNGSLNAGEDIFVGAAVPIATGTTPTSNAQFTFNGGGIGASFIEADSGNGELFIALARDSNSGPGASPTASATATISDATVMADITVAEARAVTDDAVSQATASSVILSNLLVMGELDLALSDGFDPRVQVTSSANVSVTDVEFVSDRGTFSVGDSNANDPDAVANSVSTSTWTRVTINAGGDFEVGLANTNDPNTVATVTAVATITDSTFSLSDFEVGETDADDNGISTATSTANVGQNSVVTAQDLSLGETRADDTAQAIVNATLNATDSTFILSNEIIVGELSGNSTNAATSVAATLNLIASSLVTNLLAVDQTAFSTPAGTIDATLSLNPSFASANELEVGSGGTLIFGIEGPTRVTLGTVGNMGTYAAIDAADALIEGDVVANFMAPLPAGMLTFDLIVTGSNSALDDFAGTTSITNLPAGAFLVSFGVVEDGGVDILRLIVESTLAVVDPFTVLEDSGINAFDVLANDVIAGPGSIVVVSVIDPANGSAVINAGTGNIDYSPDADFCNDGVTTDDFSYTITGGMSATVAVTVTCVNDVPVFSAGPNQTVSDSVGALLVNPWATGISAGPADEAGQTLSFAITGNTNPGVLSVAPTVNASGVLSYTPAPGVGGATDITLELMDDGGTANAGVDTSATQTFTINVMVAAADDAFTVLEDSLVNSLDVLANDTTPGPGLFVVESVTDPANGAAVINLGTGAIDYTPDADSCNDGVTTDDFSYTITGGSFATVAVTVTCINDPPSFSLSPDITLPVNTSGAQSQSNFAFNISAGPSDESSQVLTFSLSELSDPNSVVSGLTMSPSGTLSYTASGNGGVAVVQVQLSDNGGGLNTSAPRSFQITVGTAVDIAVNKTDGLPFVFNGMETTYMITVTNLGPADAPMVTVFDDVPEQLSNPTWTCTPMDGASCSPVGNGDIDEVVNLPASSSVMYMLDAKVEGLAPGANLSNTVTASVSVDQFDSVPGNNVDTDVSVNGALFFDGFEEPGAQFRELLEALGIDPVP